MAGRPCCPAKSPRCRSSRRAVFTRIAVCVSTHAPDQSNVRSRKLRGSSAVGRIAATRSVAVAQANELLIAELDPGGGIVTDATHHAVGRKYERATAAPIIRRIGDF